MRKNTACFLSVIFVLMILFSGCAKKESYQPIEVKEFGYSVVNGTVYYAACIHNPNESLCVRLSNIRITAKDSNGILLGTKENYVPPIYPQQDTWISGFGCEVEENPETIVVEVKPFNDSSIIKVSKAKHPSYIPLTVINYAKRERSGGSWIDSEKKTEYKIVGEIKNNNDYAIEYASVTIVYRDENGKIIGGDSFEVRSIPANGTAPFERDEYSHKNFGDIIEVYACMVD